MATMNDCKKTQPLLSEYVDGTLSGDDAWSVKLHLASCAVCSQVADEISATASLLRGLPRLDTSDAFEDALARRLANQVLQPRPMTLLDRFRDRFTLPQITVRRTAVLTTAGAVAAIVPFGIFFAVRNNLPSSPDIRQLPPPSRAIVSESTGSTGQQLLRQAWEEHTAEAEPLGDQSALLLASSNAASKEDGF